MSRVKSSIRAAFGDQYGSRIQVHTTLIVHTHKLYIYFAANTHTRPMYIYMNETKIHTINSFYSSTKLNPPAHVVCVWYFLPCLIFHREPLAVQQIQKKKGKWNQRQKNKKKNNNSNEEKGEISHPKKSDTYHTEATHVLPTAHSISFRDVHMLLASVPQPNMPFNTRIHPPVFFFKWISLVFFILFLIVLFFLF